MTIPLRKGKALDGMRAAGEAARDVLLATADVIKPGVTTGEVDQFAAEMIAKMGLKSAFLGYHGFPGTICISMNEEVVHGIGGERRIQLGDIVKIDVGVVKDGWIGDNAITVPVGDMDPLTHRLLYATEESLHAAIEHAVDGNMLGDLCASVEEVVVAHGFRVVREFVGHGVGRKLHEEPQVPNFGRKGARPKLKEGMILAIEPMVNAGSAAVRILEDDWTVVTRDGAFSSHFEHTVAVGKKKAEILTPRDRRIEKPVGI
ncbi:type I methionyl aminopeptidase [Sulfuriroseicoccus oceanibius]|uniref:Methionine aminopeptidase n=1 Tax=Sulfuriroseicoccus oceanibius TaxID=2707525 RepID=A0A6B3LDW0_9BACT|nr:type I methionyl aminopeptidase [Sulfuriroseicoccus oceanibius]QQL45036.1 type I methionyl aminopeptidase [Sulfuriroseicoccus oceanibius]